jgi:hypothetical protein
MARRFPLNVFTILSILFSFHYSAAQTDSIRQRIFLIGDAGELKGFGPKKNRTAI